MKHLFRFIKPVWVRVLVGVTLSVLSILVTHILISINIPKIETLKRDVAILDSAISNQWHNLQINELKILITSILLNQNHVNSPSAKATTQYINAIIAASSLPEITDFSDNKQLYETLEKLSFRNNESINALYLDKSKKEDLIMALEEQNNSFQSLAVFLHVIGLIFVLSKDIRK